MIVYSKKFTAIPEGGWTHPTALAHAGALSTACFLLLFGVSCGPDPSPKPPVQISQIQGDLIEPEPQPAIRPETGNGSVTEPVTALDSDQTAPTPPTSEPLVSPEAPTPTDAAAAAELSSRDNRDPDDAQVASAPEAARPSPLETPPVAPDPITRASASEASESPASPEAAAAAGPAEMIDDYRVVPFDLLASFHYEVPYDDAPAADSAAEGPGESTQPDGADEEGEGKQKSPSQIPSTIKALDAQQVALKGFMLPLKVQNGLVTELLIMRDQSMCCFGTVPKINEWVSVRMVDRGVKPLMDEPVTLLGTLRVGEILENGYLVGIYEMDGDEMRGPLDL